LGTNYFAIRDATEGRDDAVQHHIGKSAGGWPFMFRAHEEMGVHDWPTWQRYLSRPGIRIKNKYGDQLTVNGLMHRVTGARENWRATYVSDALDGDLAMTLDGDLTSGREFR